jgi:hypothetical protein
VRTIWLEVQPSNDDIHNNNNSGFRVRFSVRIFHRGPEILFPAPPVLSFLSRTVDVSVFEMYVYFSRTKTYITIIAKKECLNSFPTDVAYLALVYIYLRAYV